MINNNPYESQRAMNNAALYSFNNNAINDVNVVGMNFATNDPTALCLSGNAYTIKMKGD